MLPVFSPSEIKIFVFFLKRCTSSLLLFHCILFCGLLYSTFPIEKHGWRRRHYVQAIGISLSLQTQPESYYYWLVYQDRTLDLWQTCCNSPLMKKHNLCSWSSNEIGRIAEISRVAEMRIREQINLITRPDVYSKKKTVNTLTPMIIKILYILLIFYKH